MANEGSQAGQRWTRDYVFDILRELDIKFLFGVPGTNEIPIIDGCEVAGNDVRYVECLHENIAMGAAMGYARMTGKVGVLLVHVTPGIAHGIGNLFNAWRSRVPLVVLCCQQHNELVTQEPLLASNLVQLASQYTKWSHELRSWEETPLVLQRAFKEAMASPAGPVFVSIPWEFTIHEIGPDDKVRGVTRIPPRFTGDSEAVTQAADLLANAKSPVIIAGDGVGYADAWPEMQKLAALIGAPVYLQTFSSLQNFPNTDYHWQGELPGDQQQIQARMKLHDVAFLCGFGAQAQLAVFKYSLGPMIPDSVRQVYLSNNTWDIGKNHYGEVSVLGDIKATLPLINKLLVKASPKGAAKRNAELQQLAQKRGRQWETYLEKARKADKIWGVLVANALRELIVEKNLRKKFVYVHEAISDGAAFQLMLPFGEASTKPGAKPARFAGPVSYYCVAGGSLGWSMPASLGIKLAGEESQDVKPELVINAVGDGSSLFYPQVWWTAAHRGIPVLYIIMNNQEYRTLQLGLGQVVAAYGNEQGYNWKPVTMTPEYLTLRNPDFDFVSVARAFGVPDGITVEKPDDVKSALQHGIEQVLKQKKSFVIDMRIAQITPPPDANMFAEALKAEPSIEQPSLDIFYQERAGATDELAGTNFSNLPVLF